MIHPLTSSLVAAAATLAAPDPSVALRGLAASVEVDYAPALRARSEQSPNTPMLVRVSRLTDARQRIEFIGAVAGPYDLRDFIEREDGKPLADLAPIPVSVVSKLPPGHGADLFDSGAAWFNWRAHYTEILVGGLIAWACIPVAYLLWRAARRPRAVVAPPPPPPETIEDQLRAALAASSGSLSVEERGRLELLVFRYFAQRLDRPDLAAAEPAEVYRQLREHGQSRDLILALERWLHARAGEEAARAASSALDELRRTRLTPTPAGGAA